MSDVPLLVSAFLMGLFGSIHCAAMCGGLSMLLHSQLDTRSPSPVAKHALAIGAGRLTSYMVAGVMAASIGATVIAFIGRPLASTTMTVAVGLFLIMVGLQLTGWWSGIRLGNRMGQRFWSLLQPLLRSVLPVNTPLRAFGAGALWGWLPCGLVYSALLLVVGSGKPLTGALMMLLFGLGTMPMVSTIGLAGQRISISKIKGLRQTAGIMLMAFGAYAVLALAGSAAMHH